MLFRLRNAATLGTALALGVVWSGCEAKKQTEYVAGISTQVQVPRDLKTVRIDVSIGGANVFCRAYRVYDGKVQLPRSLGSLPQSSSHLGEPVSVTVVGFTEELGDDSRSNEYDCLKAIKAGENARILRRSRQPYVQDKILFLPMALKYSCFDKDCETSGQDKTCKAGRCVDAAIAPEKLPEFSEDLVDGTGGGCFHASTCFAAAVPPVVVNTADCTYALPNTKSAPPLPEGVPPNPISSTGDGINVLVSYDGGFTNEILDKDEEEGFTIPDPEKPQQFRLAPGLCDMVKGKDPDGNTTAHRITAIRATGVCQAKSPFQPLCASDQLAAMGVDPSGVASNLTSTACKPLELKPPKAALMVLADDTQNSDKFFNEVGKPTLDLSFSAPALESTEIGLTYFPGTTGASCNFPTAVPFAPANVAKSQVLDSLTARGSALQTLGTAVQMDGALQSAYATLEDPQLADVYRKAVLVIGNRGFDSNACTSKTPAVLAGTAHTDKKIDTYVVLLARDNTLPAETVLPGSSELAAQGGTDGAYDARKDKTIAQDAFQRIVNDLATCAYEVSTASDRPVAGDVLGYSNPINPATVAVPFDTACTSQNGAGSNGWGLDPSNDKRLYLCGSACSDYRNTVRTAALYAAQTLQPAIAVPIFANKKDCVPPSTP